MASSTPIPIKLKLPHPHCFHFPPNSWIRVHGVGIMKMKTKGPAIFSRYAHTFRRDVIVRARISSDGGGDSHQSASTEIDDLKSSSSFGDNYLALFVRMLGLDHDPLDREQGIVALWKYSLGGKKCIDAIMQFPGCINLTVNLLRSESSSTCEAAAGLLRSISLVNLYRDIVAESGAVEEITGLLHRPSLLLEVKEQSICTLWNLSVDEKLRIKIAKPDILPLLIKYLDDEDIKVKEAVGGVLANLALSPVNHKIMVELGLIAKLAKYVKANEEGSKVINKEARNALLELAKDEYYRILIIEEGLVPVPMIGASAYKSFRPSLHTWPSLPDGTKIEQSFKGPSRFGASELLLGLNIDNKNAKIDEAKQNAIVGRTQQQFLARIGAIEFENGKQSQSEFSNDHRRTILPWMDGVARLVLILELEDELAVLRAVESIADASINEHMRVSFKEARAIKHLVRLLDCKNDALRWTVVRALEKLSLSNSVCHTIETEGALDPLFSILKLSSIPEHVIEKILSILSKILDPSKEMKSKFYDGPVNGSRKGMGMEMESKFSVGPAGNSVEQANKHINSRKGVMDPSIISRLVELLKASSPYMQKNAALILEFATIIEPDIRIIVSADIESGLNAVFQQRVLVESNEEDLPPETYTLKVEEAGLAVSAAARLLTKLLDFKEFSSKINSSDLIEFLRKILKSDIPLHNKDWVAACLIRLSSISASTSNPNIQNPINTEVTLYETIPRLLEHMNNSISMEVKEAAAMELNRIVAEGIVDSGQAIVSQGGIPTLVKLIEEGSERASEAALAVVYNLSMDWENHAAILAANAVPPLRRMVLAQRPHWEKALRLLRTLPT